MGSMTSVSVVIPTKNAGSDFHNVLQRIRDQNFPEIEIVVIDSGSTDGTVDIAKDKADKIVEIPPEKFHHGQTRNQGAEHSSGDIIVFTVQDAIPMDSEWLPELVRPISDGSADVTYGNQVAYPDAKPPDKFFYEYFYPDEPVGLGKGDTADKASFYLDNVFLSDVSSAILRDVWENIRFRDSVDMSEDKDFAYRAASAGHTIRYCPEAKVYHSHNYTLRSLFSRRYKDGKAFSDIATNDSSSFISEGIKYVCSEYSYLIRSSAVHWIPYTLLYDLVYFISFIIGQNHDQVPTALDQRLSR